MKNHYQQAATTIVAITACNLLAGFTQTGIGEGSAQEPARSRSNEDLWGDDEGED